jgi:acyl-coenzyme A synthetase/AMP-(fatty) acid ligase
MSLALVNDNGALSYHDLDLALRFGCARRLGCGRRVAIVTRSNWFGAHAIAVLNGAVDALFLCPADVSVERRRRFFDAGGIDAVVTDDAEALEGRDRIGGDGVQSLLQVDDKPADADAPCGTRWLLATSGTTNEPKLIEHTMRSLCWSVSQRLHGDAVIWALCYSVMRFAGLQVFMQSLFTRATLAVPTDNACLGQQIAFFARQNCNNFSATASYWRKVLMRPESDRLSPRQITLGGEIADPQVMRALQSKWPDARLIHIYASTETGVGFVVTDGRPGFPEAFLEDPPRGVRLAISSRDTLLIKPLVTDQEIRLGGESLYDENGFIDTGDLVEHRDGRIYFLGRSSGVINVGGDKVVPEEVELVLRECPGIVAALVKERKNPILGALVEASVVQILGTPTGATRAMQIKEFCMKRLAPYKVPAIVNFVNNIETNQSGKQVRKS